MSKSINFNNISDTALTMASSYNKGFRTSKTVRDYHANIIKAAEKVLQDIIDLREKAVEEDGLTANEAIAKYSTLEAQKTLERAKTAKSEAVKGLNEMLSDGRAMVSHELYLAYVSYMETGNTETFKAEVTAFLTTIGIFADPEWARSAKFTDLMVARVSGRKKATGKQQEAGNYSQTLTERTFKDRFMQEFLQFMVTDKGVLDEDVDHNLVRHVWEAKEETEIPQEESVETGKAVA